MAIGTRLEPTQGILAQHDLELANLAAARLCLCASSSWFAYLCAIPGHLGIVRRHGSTLGLPTVATDPKSPPRPEWRPCICLRKNTMGSDARAPPALGAQEQEVGIPMPRQGAMQGSVDNGMNGEMNGESLPLRPVLIDASCIMHRPGRCMSRSCEKVMLHNTGAVLNASFAAWHLECYRERLREWQPVTNDARAGRCRGDDEWEQSGTQIGRDDPRTTDVSRTVRAVWLSLPMEAEQVRGMSHGRWRRQRHQARIT